MSRIDGMTASTKAMRPVAVLRSWRDAWWSIRYSTSGLRARWPIPGRRVLADDLVGILPVGQAGDTHVLELTPESSPWSC